MGSLAPGTEVGDYQVVAPISSGGMGAVYRARRQSSGEQVALKQLLKRSGARRFEIEARLLGALDHPRVVRVLDHFEDAGGHFLVMELVEGPNLWEILARRGDPGLVSEEAVEYVGQACEALAYVHAQHVVHRDVKPQNLILGSDGVVLVDFGIAREYSPSQEGTGAIGTPGYMAPEVLGGFVSPRSDVFGIAATLWTLLTGDAPRYDETMEVGITQLDAALRAGLALDPNRRIASVEAFAAATGRPLGAPAGASLARSVEQPAMARTLMEGVVRAAAGVFEAAASSLALVDRATGELVYEAAWGAGASEIVGMRLNSGVGVAGAVVASGQGEAIPDCRGDSRFAATVATRTGYVPGTMLTVPLRRGERTLGVLQVLDRRDAESYGPEDVERAAAFADLALMAVDVQLSGRETIAP